MLPTIREYLPLHVDALVKAASYEEDLPWYGVTAGGVIGGELGRELARKHPVLGTLGGALLGTAAGLHGGKGIGRKIDSRQRKKTAMVPVTAISVPAAISSGKAKGFGMANMPMWPQATMADSGGYFGMGGDLAFMLPMSGLGVDMSGRGKPVRVKRASVEEKKPGVIGPASKIIGKGLAGLTLGTVAGYGTGKAVEHLSGRKIPMKYVTAVPAIAGAGLGIAHSLWKARELEALKRVVQDAQ